MLQWFHTSLEVLQVLCMSFASFAFGWTIWPRSYMIIRYYTVNQYVTHCHPCRSHTHIHTQTNTHQHTQITCPHTYTHTVPLPHIHRHTHTHTAEGIPLYIEIIRQLVLGDKLVWVRTDTTFLTRMRTHDLLSTERGISSLCVCSNRTSSEYRLLFISTQASMPASHLTSVVI